MHHETTLSNGLTILAEPTPTARSFAAGFFVRTGSRDEPADVNGVSHFLEHMMFKGSETLDADAMNRIFDDLGARHNAYTTQEMTAYYAAVLPEFSATVMEHLGQLMRPAIRTADFDTEKNVILEEIAMYQDDPGHRVFERLMELYFNGHPLGMSILGPAERISAMTRDQMADYFRAHYGPRNTVLSVTGKFDFDEVVDLAERYYGGWEPVGFERDFTEVSFRRQRGRTSLMTSSTASTSWASRPAPAARTTTDSPPASSATCSATTTARGSTGRWSTTPSARRRISAPTRTTASAATPCRSSATPAAATRRWKSP